MPNLFFAREELRFAKEELELFNNDKQNSFGPNKHWANFLTHLELSFVKAERGCQDIENLFRPFQGTFINKRRKEPLLNYLKNARDASQHGIDILVSLEIKEKIQIDSISLSKLDKDGNIVETNEHPLYPAEMRLKSFFINGQTYNPPKYYNGRKLRRIDNPIEIGMLGINFYEDFINKVEKKFITNLNDR